MSPGDLICSMRSLVPWHKSVTGDEWIKMTPIPVGTYALVINIWKTGTKTRMLVLVNGRATMFSHGVNAVNLCWRSC